MPRVQTRARDVAATDYGVELIGSSNGCSSFTVHLGSLTLKCYECLTPHRAKLVRSLSTTLRKQGIPMPKCFGVAGNVVISEWVHGRPMTEVGDSEKVELMAAYQAAIHGATLSRADRRHASMPHFRWLFKRVRAFGREVIGDAFLSRLYEDISKARPAAAPWGVLHSDFITTNLLVTQRGAISVDNEFLCFGFGQEWDVLNTMKVSFPDRPRLQDRYLNAYAKYRSLHTLVSHRDYWEAIYDIKMAGKRLAEATVEEGLRYLKAAAQKV